MQLAIPESAVGRALSFIARATQAPVALAPAAAPTFTLASGEALRQPCAVAHALAAAAPNAQWAGKSATEQALITQWLSLVLQPPGFDATPAALKDLNTHLSKLSFAAGHQLTVADAALWQAVWPAVNAAGNGASAWPAVVRWGNTVAAQLLAAGVGDLPAPAQLELPAPAVQFDWATTAPPAPAGAAAAAAVSGSDADAKASGKSQSDGKADKKAGKRTAQKASKSDGKADKKKKGGAAAPAADDLGAIAKVQLLVGKVLKAWAHPEAERLYVEEIDVGEEAPRTICSGLREHVALEDLQDSLVVVAANLKPRPLVGIKSAGMVLCAQDPDAGKVELLRVPAGAKPGERVQFQGHMADPAPPNQVAKKKMLEKTLPDLVIKSDGTAAWKDVPFMTSAGPISARTLKKGRVG